MSKRRFSVLGAGPGGLAMAAHLVATGGRVCVYNRGAERAESIRSGGGIRVSGELEGTYPVDEVTCDIRRAADHAEVLFVVVPAYAHADIAAAVAQHLRDDHIVILCPGRTGGALEFSRVVQERKPGCGAVVVETQTILHTCRMANEGGVEIFAIKRNVPLAAFPSTKTSHVLEILSPDFPQFSAGEDVLETSMGNVGAILHPAPTLLNVGWIEALRAQFLYYYEGITPSVGDLLESLDRERMAVAAALGTRAISVCEWLCRTYGATGNRLHDAIQSNPAYRGIYAPQSVNHRYLYEDVPTGLVPISSLGDLASVETPHIDTIVDLASAVCGVDFRRRGRTIQSLHLEGLTIDDLHRHVENGPATS